MSIRCFMIVPTGKVHRWLRRWASKLPNEVCSLPYHNAFVPLDLVDKEYADVYREHDEGDPRWPTSCTACGFKFRPYDSWQVFRLTIYRDSECREFTVHDNPPSGIDKAPSGAMWHAEWNDDLYSGPDGKCIALMTPGGVWLIDGPSTNGGNWIRTGEPPNLTATPSIIAGNYHGWLRDGHLVPA